MEAIGGVASITQLIHTATALAGGVIYLCERLRNAAEEFRALEKEVSGFRTELHTCEDAVAKCHPALLTKSTVDALTPSIIEGNLYLGQLSCICQGVQDVKSFKFRARWLCKDRPKANKVLTDVRRVRHDLHSAMQPLIL